MDPGSAVGTRTLGGRDGLTVSSLGLGCMGMSQSYGPADRDESVATIHRALDLGVTFLDTSDVYGPHTNEVLVGKAIAGRRDEVVLATKFGVRRGTEREFDGRPENVRRSIEGSLKRLGTDHVDLYYQHRIDPQTPIEETVGALAELADEGKIRTYGVSNVDADQLREAAAAGDREIGDVHVLLGVLREGGADGLLRAVGAEPAALREALSPAGSRRGRGG